MSLSPIESVSQELLVGKPAVLENRYPVYDPAGNKCQFVKLRFYCGHIEQFYSLDLGRMGGFKWKPRSTRQLVSDHLRITCPIAYTLCRNCTEEQKMLELVTLPNGESAWLRPER